MPAIFKFESPRLSGPTLGRRINIDSDLKFVKLSLADAKPAEIAAIAAALQYETQNGDLPAEVFIGFNNNGKFVPARLGQKIFPNLEPPVTEKTLVALGKAWLENLSVAAPSDSPAETCLRK